jgi:hypothetical protein
LDTENEVLRDNKKYFVLVDITGSNWCDETLEHLLAFEHDLNIHTALPAPSDLRSAILIFGLTLTSGSCLSQELNSSVRCEKLLGPNIVRDREGIYIYQENSTAINTQQEGKIVGVGNLVRRRRVR